MFSIAVQFQKKCMDAAQRKRDQHEIEKYLESKRVYQLLEELMKSICINQPKNPIDFLIQKLEEPERTRWVT